MITTSYFVSSGAGTIPFYLKITTKMLQWVTPLLKVCTDPLTEDNNGFFSRGSPTALYLSFGLAVLFGSPNNLINYFGVPEDLPLGEGFFIGPYPSFSSLILKKNRVFSPKTI